MSPPPAQARFSPRGEDTPCTQPAAAGVLTETQVLNATSVVGLWSKFLRFPALLSGVVLLLPRAWGCRFRDWLRPRSLLLFLFLRLLLLLLLRELPSPSPVSCTGRALSHPTRASPAAGGSLPLSANSFSPLQRGPAFSRSHGAAAAPSVEGAIDPRRCSSLLPPLADLLRLAKARPRVSAGGPATAAAASVSPATDIAFARTLLALISCLTSASCACSSFFSMSSRWSSNWRARCIDGVSSAVRARRRPPGGGRQARRFGAEFGFSWTGPPSSPRSNSPRSTSGTSANGFRGGFSGNDSSADLFRLNKRPSCVRQALFKNLSVFLASTTHTRVAWSLT